MTAYDGGRKHQVCLEPSMLLPLMTASAARHRQAILHELRHWPEAAALLPFARLWLGRPSSFVWQQGPTSRRISQADGVEHRAYEARPLQQCCTRAVLYESRALSSPHSVRPERLQQCCRTQFGLPLKSLQGLYICRRLSG